MKLTEILNTSSALYHFENTDGLTYLNNINNDSIDLVLTDPPYIISKQTGMNTFYNKVKDNKKDNLLSIKTLEEWQNYKIVNNINDDMNKNNYIKYGTIYGKKYCVKTDYGKWDSDFTVEELDKFIQLYYAKLRKGGTLIIFFDL